MPKFFLLLAIIMPAGAFAEKTYRVVGMEFRGNNRSEISWLQNYLGYEFPMEMSGNETGKIEDKLLTTQVFSKVNASLKKVLDTPESYVLEIELTEKWTTIPVFRGSFGGGTPLRVVGVYDIHSFGRLWTLGGETHKYGSEPLGGVVWAREPRANQGNHVRGLEYWRQFRRRSIYDDEDKLLGYIKSDFSLYRFLYLIPFRLLSPTKWQAGLDVRIRQESENEYRRDSDASSDDPPEGITLSEKPRAFYTYMARLVYDDMTINNVNYDGFRMVTAGGPIFSKSESSGRAELDWYYYWVFKTRLNLAWHHFIGQTTTDSIESQYYLGGLDSIRGIPDGAVYGTRASYVNAEIRQITLKSHYLWLQNVAFVDSGGAGSSWADAREKVRSSAGLGVRFVVPQVYRLIFRLDYAWSLDRPGTSGITAGMNQLFQPYKPL